MRTAMIIGFATLLSGCTMWSNQPTVPETSRTAVVHDVHVSLTEIEPLDLRANVGDEVRFINDKTQPIRIVLIDGGKSIACNKGFNGAIDQEADIKPGQYAGFCFSKPGTVKYMARDQTAVTGTGLLCAIVLLEAFLSPFVFSTFIYLHNHRRPHELSYFFNQWFFPLSSFRHFRQQWIPILT